MKNQLLTSRVLKLLYCVFSLVLLFSIVLPNASLAQQTVVTGEVYVYTTPDDTLSLKAEDGIIKFYMLTSSGNLILKATATLDEDGKYYATVTGTQDLYAVIFPEDIDQSNFVASYYPGWLDFESADPIATTNGDTIDYDWGAVGKEIVERPSAGAIINTVSGKVNIGAPFMKSDFVPMAYLLGDNESVIASAPITMDGRYSLSFLGGGNYEVFTTVPGFASQSKYISVQERTKSDLTVDFNLEVYRGEVESTPVNTVADNFTLNQNYPNPFNPSTNISFIIPEMGLVKLTVYNSLGKEVSKLVNDLMEPGTYSILYNAHNLSSGIYYYTLQVGNNVVTKRMNLIK